MEDRKSIRNVKPPLLIKEAYNGSDILLVRNFVIEDDEDIEQLKDMGVKYYIPEKGNSETHESSNGQAKDSDSKNGRSGLFKDPHEAINTQIQQDKHRYNQTIKRIKEEFKKVRQNDIDYAELKSYLNEDIEFFVEQAEEKPECLSALSQLKSYEDDIYQHSLNVSLLAIIYGSYMDYNYQQLKLLGFGALLHDIGKTLIPDDVIHNPEELSKAEWDIIRSHSQKGEQVLNELGADKFIQKIAKEHHERPDGSGYPEGKTNEDIHPYAEVVAVCDVYEALTAKRVYKSSTNPVRAFIIMKDEFMGNPHTREIMKGLIRALGIYPVGSMVRLSNRETAVVKKNHPENLQKPTIVVIRDKWDRPLTTPLTVNLKHADKQKRGGIHGEVYDDSIEIEKVLPLREYPERGSRVASLIEEKAPVPV